MKAEEVTKNVLSIIEKQKLFDEYMEKMNALNNLSPSQQIRAMLDIENFLSSLFERGYRAGFEKGLKQGISIIKN